MKANQVFLLVVVIYLGIYLLQKIKEVFLVSCENITFYATWDVGNVLYIQYIYSMLVK